MAVAGTYLIDGVALDDPAGRWALTSDTTLPTWGAMTTADVDIPGRDGVVALAPTAMGAATVTLGLLARATASSTLDDTLSALSRLLRRRALVDVTRVSPTGVRRVAQSRVTSSVEPVYSPIDQTALLKIVVQIPGGVWRSTSESTVRMALGSPTALTSALAVRDATLMVTASASRVALTDAVSRTSLTLDGAVSGSAYRVRIADWSAARVASTTAWTETGTDVSGRLSMTPGGLALTPAPANGAVTLQAVGATEVLCRYRGCW